MKKLKESEDLHDSCKEIAHCKKKPSKRAKCQIRIRGGTNDNLRDIIQLERYQSKDV